MLEDLVANLQNHAETGQIPKPYRRGSWRPIGHMRPSSPLRTDDNRCSNFTGHEAEDYCKLQGGHAVSLDTTAKALHFIDVAIADARRYFWTGGRIDHTAGVVTWPSGNREGYVRGQRFWSHTGG